MVGRARPGAAPLPLLPHPVLRRDVLVLRLLHQDRQSLRAGPPVPRRPGGGDRARRRGTSRRLSRPAPALGRRQPDHARGERLAGTDSEAQPRIYADARRRARRRNRSARRHGRIHRRPRRGRGEPRQHRRAGLSPRGSGRGQPPPAVRRRRAGVRLAAPPRHHRHQPRPDVRPAPPDGGAGRSHGRSGHAPRAGSRRPVRLRPRAVDEEPPAADRRGGVAWDGRALAAERGGGQAATGARAGAHRPRPLRPAGRPAGGRCRQPPAASQFPGLHHRRRRDAAGLWRLRDPLQRCWALAPPRSAACRKATCRT